MLYNTKKRNDFCKEWVERNGESEEYLYAKHQPLRWKLRDEKIIGPSGPTGTDYLAYLASKKLDKMYKMTDRSLFGARPTFIKVYKKEEKLDGMSEEELARRLGMTLLSNTTECSCDRFETEEECVGSGLGCQWQPPFESCHPPEMIDDGLPICETTEPPTMSPTLNMDRLLKETESPTVAVETGSDGTEGSGADKASLEFLASLFKTREHEDDIDPEEDGASDVRRSLLVSSEAEPSSKLGVTAGGDDNEASPVSPETQKVIDSLFETSVHEDAINLEREDTSNMHRNLLVSPDSQIVTTAEPSSPVEVTAGGNEAETSLERERPSINLNKDTINLEGDGRSNMHRNLLVSSESQIVTAAELSSQVGITARGDKKQAWQVDTSLERGGDHPAIKVAPTKSLPNSSEAIEDAIDLKGYETSNMHRNQVVSPESQIVTAAEKSSQVEVTVGGDENEASQVESSMEREGDRSTIPPIGT